MRSNFVEKNGQLVSKVAPYYVSIGNCEVEKENYVLTSLQLKYASSCLYLVPGYTKMDPVSYQLNQDEFESIEYINFDSPDTDSVVVIPDVKINTDEVRTQIPSALVGVGINLNRRNGRAIAFDLSTTDIASALRNDHSGD